MKRNMTSDDTPAIVPKTGDCPEMVAEAVIAILHYAIISIRSAGYADDVKYCTLEADHVHNLPSLLRQDTRHKLEWYLKYEVPGYAADYQKQFGRPRVPLAYWEQLQSYLDATAGDTESVHH